MYALRASVLRGPAVHRSRRSIKGQGNQENCHGCVAGMPVRSPTSEAKSAQSRSCYRHLAEGLLVAGLHMLQS